MQLCGEVQLYNAPERRRDKLESEERRKQLKLAEAKAPNHYLLEAGLIEEIEDVEDGGAASHSAHLAADPRLGPHPSREH